MRAALAAGLLLAALPARGAMLPGSQPKEWPMHGKTYANVYVVTLKLTFDANFTEEATTGVHFDKQRTVVLDARGAVQAIEGDGETEMPMLAI